MLTRALVLKVAEMPAFKNWVMRSRLTQGLVQRFIAGEDVETALAVASRLNSEGFLVALDYLGEDTQRLEDAQQATNQYIHLLERIAERRVNACISIKLTQLGLDLGCTVARDNLARVLEAARNLNNFVWVDMESSKHTQAILDVFCELYPRYPNSGTVLQSYLYRTPQDLERLLNLGARVRLVKGAYAEPRDVAYPDKRSVDRQFKVLMERLLERGNEPAIATHDTRLIQHAKRYAAQLGLDKSKYEFQLLYGVRRDLQKQLVAEGYRTLIYVPYGEQWYPYFSRRLAERPANLYFVLRNLLRR
ncbi:MAG: proline dehydrogenase family protein [Fimbriimonadales bacterium]|nr:proline dehydrogenase family protein [Fimbriimonadales bacterium]MDW8051806.1 proline dehydrogenase family protein [Armatimonadota bacterium]